MSTATPTDDARTPTRRSTRTRRLAVRGLLVAGLLALLASCTPDQMRQWYDGQGIDHSQMTEQEVANAAAVATDFWAEQADLNKFNWVLNDDQLWRLRQCESGGNYGIVSSSGTYRGAYQFAQSTWNSVASQHYPRYVGLDPAAARPQVQDAMARALWSMTGPRSWPVCGYKV